MNLTPEVLLGVITAVGGVLTGAITALARVVFAELTDCKQDRVKLNEKTDGLNNKLVDLSQEVGRMQGHFEFMDKRNTSQHHNP